MRKFFLVAAQLVFTITVFAQGYRYATQNLNLRRGPATSFQVLATIPAGTNVKLAENCVCEWIRVYYNGKTGYVSSKYLNSGQQKNFLRSEEATTSRPENASASRIRHYTNVAGQRVQSPTKYNSIPAGATAKCRDGTYSFSKNRRGTCSHHGGVAKWL